VTNFRRQSLRIPSGWLVAYTDFWEVEPDEVPVDEASCWFKEDLLQLFHERANRLLDLGWYPDASPVQGVYRVELYVGDCRGELLRSFSSPSRQAVVAEIERLLQEVDFVRL